MLSSRTRAVSLGGLCVVISVALVACTSPSTPPAPQNRMMGGQAAPRTVQPTAPAGGGESSATGKQIWLSGVGGSGQYIARTAPRTSQGALMMGGGGCASCHGEDGRGGTTQMMMGPAIEAPDVTYDALIKAGFTPETIGKAITQGLDESGKTLDQAMPRWRMSPSDVQATIAYLKVLSAR